MNRYDSANRAGILGILANIFLLVIKATVGFVSHSQSMIADSFNSAGDIFASFMTFVGNKISRVPDDDDHNFGHGKAEYIFSFLISMSMIAISLKIFYDAIMAIINKNVVVFSWGLVIVSVTTIVVKLVLYFYTKRVYLEHRNVLVYSNMIDHRNDSIIATFTFISIFLSRYNIYWFDCIVGIGISLWILYTGIKIFMESYNILMDMSVDDATRIEIVNYISNYDEIKGIESLYSIPTGYKYIIVITVMIDGNMSTFDSHGIVDELESVIIKNIVKVDKVIIHINPI